MEPLEYHLSLEKAVLEYAASATAHPLTKANQTIQIPCWIDEHVWGMASSLSEKGHISASVPEDRRRVRVSELNEAGAIRLKELTAREQQLVEAQRVQMEEAVERARQKKWWRRMMPGKASV